MATVSDQQDLQAAPAAVVPAGQSGRPVAVAPGPVLLEAPFPGLSLSRHRTRWPRPDPRVRYGDLSELLRRARIRGRGGAGFPFADKIAAAGGRARTVVVNAAESEPGSAKDAALLLTVPHLVLDGAELVATALRTSRVHVVVSGHRPAVEEAVREAVAARDAASHWTVGHTTGGFVGGHSGALVEMLDGRANRPATRWAPSAAGGRKGAVVLSNAETFAQVAAAWAMGPGEFSAYGTDEEPGTTLLTVGGDGRVDRGTATVAEVEHGRLLIEVVPELADTMAAGDGPIPGGALVGGYHGTWLSADQLERARVGRVSARRTRPMLGAGVVLPLAPGVCPLPVTASILGFLAAERARQCGPCDVGLPELAGTAVTLARGGRAATSAPDHLVRVARLVDGRGACSHPDGSARLALSLLESFPHEVEIHRRGGCSRRQPA